METITIKKEIFEELLQKKEELDAIVETIELLNRQDVKEAIKKSREDIKAGNTHSQKMF